jgi:hypothetical protein
MAGISGSDIRCRTEELLVCIIIMISIIPGIIVDILFGTDNSYEHINTRKREDTKFFIDRVTGSTEGYFTN